MPLLSYSDSTSTETLLGKYSHAPSMTLIRVPEIEYLRKIVWTGAALDHCCGDGFLSPIIWEQGFAAGVDFSEKALAMAKNRQEPDGAPYYRELKKSDVGDSLPWDDATFDGVLNNSGLEHVENASVAVAEIARVLKPGGLFVFTLAGARAFDWWPANLPAGSREVFIKHQPYHNILSLEEWKGLLADHGLEIADFETHLSQEETERCLYYDYKHSMAAFGAEPLTGKLAFLRKYPRVGSWYYKRLIRGARYHSASNEDVYAFYCISARKKQTQ